MGLFSEKVVGKAKEVLEGMVEPLTMTYFTRETECEHCASAGAFVDELSALDERLQVERKDFVEDRALADELGVHHVPCLILHRPDDGRPAVRYYGVPGGHEFGAFLHTLILFSGGKGADAFDRAAVAALDREVNLKVFVLTTCPSCPVMAYLAASLAWTGPKITAEIIEANSFADLAARFTVGTVPKIVINDTHEVVGVLPGDELVRKITTL